MTSKHKQILVVELGGGYTGVHYHILSTLLYVWKISNTSAVKKGVISCWPSSTRCSLGWWDPWGLGIQSRIPGPALFLTG